MLGVQPQAAQSTVTCAQNVQNDQVLNTAPGAAHAADSRPETRLGGGEGRRTRRARVPVATAVEQAPRDATPWMSTPFAGSL